MEQLADSILSSSFSSCLPYAGHTLPIYLRSVEARISRLGLARIYTYIYMLCRVANTLHTYMHIYRSSAQARAFNYVSSYRPRWQSIGFINAFGRAHAALIPCGLLPYTSRNYPWEAAVCTRGSCSRGITRRSAPADR